ncbi:MULTISPECIES: NtaA/DmoA family FMN-dependent monooxygenase [unclassified Salinibacterium]|uniref:NtaA/DmoA family FMN-dependent monooxygenase n=1 Tax=unclassified Salinibacterium TaxID=2632331 RepID=UPI00143D85E5|nr:MULTISPECIES: NtaA/DmoA family FMN-dependent monooxygenase [unclassified Salinibacterium]
MSSKPFHLGYFMNGSAAQSFGMPFSGRIGRDWSNGSFYTDTARALERGKFDFLLFEDAYHVPNAWEGTHNTHVENAIAVPRLDTIVLASMVAQATSRLGLVATLPTFAFHPYLMARLIGSLDAVSEGRGAWNVVTGAQPLAFQNFGMEMDPAEDRYAHATEYVELVKKIWESWEPDAINTAPGATTFADSSKVHTVDYNGKLLQHSGSALVSGPAPQGHPVIAQAGASKDGKILAATHADIVVGVASSPEGMKEYRDFVRAEIVRQGRNPDDTKVFFSISPILGATQEEAEVHGRVREEQARARAISTLADAADRMNVDLSRMPLDEILSDEVIDSLYTHGQRSSLDTFKKQLRGRTVRQLGEQMGSRSAQWTGTADKVASEMQAVAEEVGIDGFIISATKGGHTRRFVDEIVDGLVPALQARGLVREEYEHTQLRDNLRAF